jgi:N-methylhydantoinase A
VTDANVVLGTLNPSHLLDGRMAIRHDLAAAAIDRLAERLGMERMATADGVIAVVTANMARAIRVISVQRGYDPRDYSLVAFGGAGPLHAVRLAQALDMRRILVPRNPGILCAMGLLLTDLRADFAVTRLSLLAPAALDGVREAFRELDALAAGWFAAEGIAAGDRRVRRTVDMRYAGQNYELPVAVPEEGDVLASLALGFAKAHRRIYGFVAEEDPVQLVTFRVEASGVVPKARFSAEADGGPDASGALSGSRSVWMVEAGGFVECPVYRRDLLRAGNRFSGPAIIEQMDATTVVPAGWRALVEPYLNVVLEAG